MVDPGDSELIHAPRRRRAGDTPCQWRMPEEAALRGCGRCLMPFVSGRVELSMFRTSARRYLLRCVVRAVCIRELQRQMSVGRVLHDSHVHISTRRVERTVLGNQRGVMDSQHQLEERVGIVLRVVWSDLQSRW